MILAIHHGAAPNSFRFTADEGFVWAVVKPIGGGRAQIDVSEQDAALSAADQRTMLSGRTEELMRAARGRFGTRTMLAMMRFVKSRFPDVREWSFRRVTGANPFVDRIVRA